MNTSFLVISWYVVSVFAIVTAKKTLQQVHIPGLLCLLQLSMAAFLQKCLIASFSPAVAGMGRTSSTKEAGLVRSIALAYALGFAFTNRAFNIAPPSTIEMLKSSEPIFTVVLAAFVLGERERVLVYLALAPTVVGTAMACYSGEKLDGRVLASTMASNAAFASRSILVKVNTSREVEA